jgi:hypothetical protein
MTSSRQMTINLAATFLAFAALWGLSRVLLAAPCWAFILLVAAVAWPIWVGLREYALYRHRVTLVAATEETSRIRRWFWRGSITSNLQLLSAVVWAAVLLTLAPLLEGWHLALLALDVAVLAIAAQYWRRAMAGEIRAEVIGTHSRRMVLWSNLAFLAVGAFVIDYFVVGSPDTRGMAWSVLAEESFTQYFAHAACPAAGAAVGFVNMADRLGWHAAEVIIPSLPNAWLNLVAWMLFLLEAGLLAFAYTRLQLGMLAIVEGFTAKPADQGHPTIPVLLPALVAAGLLVTYALQGFDPAKLRRPAQDLAQWADPCRLEAGNLAALRQDLGKEIEGVRTAQRERADREVDQLLDTVFGDAEKGVDAYLDWYFSLIGEYTRLAAWVTTLPSKDAKAGLDQELEKRLFGDAGIGPRLSAENQRIAEATKSAMATTAASVSRNLGQQARLKPCWADALKMPALPAIERDVTRVATAAAGGLVAGVAIRSLAAGRLTQTVAARLAARPAFGSAAKVAMRMPARRAGALVVAAAGTGLAVCAPGGPWALLCSIAAGAAAWVAVDQAMIKIDELRFREQMREELLGALREQKEELATEMKKAHAAYVDAMAQGLAGSVDGVFLPAREGRSTEGRATSQKESYSSRTGNDPNRPLRGALHENAAPHPRAALRQP